MPFPPLDVIETMPWSSEVVAGLLDYHLVGVQCERWRENLIASARGLLGSEAGRTAEAARAGDPRRHRSGSHRRGRASSGELGSFDAMLGGRKLILGVDRLDYSKGIPERLEAFARHARDVPRVARQGLAHPGLGADARRTFRTTRSSAPRVEAIVGRINGEYGEADWVPDPLPLSLVRSGQLAQLYRAARRRARDAAARRHEPRREGVRRGAGPETIPGVLVLSQFAGAAERDDATRCSRTRTTSTAWPRDLDRALRAESTSASHGTRAASCGLGGFGRGVDEGVAGALHGLPKLQTGTERA